MLCRFNAIGHHVSYSSWVTTFVIPIMLTAQAVYTILDKNKLAMSILGAIVSIQLPTLVVYYYIKLHIHMLHHVIIDI